MSDLAVTNKRIFLLLTPFQIMGYAEISLLVHFCLYKALEKVYSKCCLLIEVKFSCKQRDTELSSFSSLLDFFFFSFTTDYSGPGAVIKNKNNINNLCQF